jgi:hypothetical protein
MKLRNKKTGEIAEVKAVKFYCNGESGQRYEWSQRKYSGGITLAELNEEWEDYKEPKGFWYIDYNGTICDVNEDPVSPIFMLKEIGNYFESEMEAEKAVEKLKAWKRLKDNGFEFESWFGGSKDISFWLDTEIDEDIAKDLDLLFGGEE